MAIIETSISSFDTIVSSIGDAVSNTVVDADDPVVQIGAVLVIILVGIKPMIQSIPLTLVNGISLMIRISLVFIFVFCFANYYTVYDIITDAPARYGTTVLEAITGEHVDNLYAGLDRLYAESLNIGEAVFAQYGLFIAGVIILISALLATISIMIICVAKLMVSVLIILGPIAVATTIFKQTAPIFDSYVRLAVGFAFIPLLAAVMTGITIAVAEYATTGILETATKIGDLVNIIVVMILGTGMMIQIPSIAQSLAKALIGLGLAQDRWNNK